MKVIYKLKNEIKIEIELTNDIINGTTYIREIEGYFLNENGIRGKSPIKLLVYKDENNKTYFVLGEEKIYLSDFLVPNINESIISEEITQRELINALKKYKDDKSFMVSLIYNTYIGPESENIIKVPRSDKTKPDLELSITLIPKDVSDINFYQPTYEILNEIIKKIESGEITVIYRDTQKRIHTLQKVMTNEAA